MNITKPSLFDRARIALSLAIMPKKFVELLYDAVEKHLTEPIKEKAIRAVVAQVAGDVAEADQLFAELAEQGVIVTPDEDGNGYTARLCNCGECE